MGEGIAASVAAIGIPASLNNILMSFANHILNQALVGYGDTPVAAMGVALKPICWWFCCRLGFAWESSR